MKLGVLVVCGALILAMLDGSVIADPTVSSAGELTLEELTRRMATSTGIVATFHEVKELALLDAPLESRGVLYFVPPDRLLRLTTSPDTARLVVENGRVSYRDAAGSEEIDLAESPVARQFVDNLIVLFNGDLPTLRKRYEIEFAADGSAWRLALTPRGVAMRHFIERIALSGNGPALREIITTEADGDRTVTTFEDVVTNHTFGLDELRRLFHATPDRATRDLVTPDPGTP